MESFLNFTVQIHSNSAIDQTLMNLSSEEPLTTIVPILRFENNLLKQIHRHKKMSDHLNQMRKLDPYVLLK